MSVPRSIHLAAVLNLLRYIKGTLFHVHGQTSRRARVQARLKDAFFFKKTNVPIIMIANILPKRIKEKGVFQERFMRIHYTSTIEELKEERVIATLWGCRKRRIFRNIKLQKKTNNKIKNIKGLSC